MDDLEKTLIDITRCQLPSKVVKCHWCGELMEVHNTCDPERDWPRHCDRNRNSDGVDCSAEMRKHYT